MGDFKVLYRKYRPTNFDEVVGQNNTIKILKNAVMNNKISHAYIFTGPRGTGKTSTAKIFAKTINCEQLANGLACNKCDSCLNFNNSADIIEIDAASNNGVDEIREIINNVKIAPTSSRYKVYIIDEVHMLSQSAFNALLLTLEEPPSHTVFILATTNIESVPITVLSRCQRFDFRKITDEDIVKQLELIAKKEKIDIDEDAIREIAYLSDGGLRDALSILNQLYTSNTKITLDLILSNYGSVSNVKIKQIANSVLNNDYNNLKNIFDDLNNMTFDYKIFIKKLVDEFFEISLEKKKMNAENDYLKIKNIIFNLNELLNKINININPFLLIFMILIENIEISNSNLQLEEIKDKNDKNSECILKDEETLNEEEKNENEKNIFFANSILPIRLNNCFATATKNQLNIAKNNWNNFILNKTLKADIKNIVIDSDIVLASEDIYVVTSEQNIMVDLFNNKIDDIENSLNKITNLNIKLLAMTKENWNKKKTEYLEKVKNGQKYVIKDEPKYLKCDIINDTSDKEITNEENFDITSIFDSNKLEVE